MDLRQLEYFVARRRGTQLHAGRGPVPRGAVGTELPDRPAGTRARRDAVPPHQPIGPAGPRRRTAAAARTPAAAGRGGRPRRTGRVLRADHRPAAARHGRQRRANAAPLVERALIAFHHRHPGVEIAVQDTGSRHMAEQVRSGDLDLAFVGLYAEQAPAGLSIPCSTDEPLVAVVARDHPLAGRPGRRPRRAGRASARSSRCAPSRGCACRSTPPSTGPVSPGRWRSSSARPTAWSGSPASDSAPRSCPPRRPRRRPSVSVLTLADPAPGIRSAWCTGHPSRPPRAHAPSSRSFGSACRRPVRIAEGSAGEPQARPAGRAAAPLPGHQGGALRARTGDGRPVPRAYLVSASTRRATSSSTVPVFGRSRLAACSDSSALVRPS